MKSLLPRSALEHHMAVLGKTGSGKTSVVKAAIVEPALAADERVCVIDPTGAWWGLRLKADGRTKGYPVYVFGGRHADYPLLGTHGEAMADVIGTTNTPAILDTSLMKTGERMKFFTDFADALLRKNEGALRLVIDEAHIFMPQAGTRGSGAMPEMLHAGNNLISLGRSRGLRIVLLSQRAAKLHKDSLTQVETLLALRLIAPQDRAAVREWIADQADLEKGKEIIASLPKLANGETWAWCPEADFLKRLQFPLPSTYDSSAAPTSSGKSKRLSPIDLDKLKDRLAKVDAVAKDNDPKLLRAAGAEKDRKIAELERKMQSQAASTAAVKPDKDAIAAAEQKGFDQAQKKLTMASEREVNKRVLVIMEGLRDLLKPLDKQLQEIVTAASKAPVDLWAPVTFTPAAPAQQSRPALQQKPVAVPRAAPSRVTAPAGDGFNRPQLKALDALALWQMLGHDAPTREQVAALSGYSPNSSTYSNLISSLRTLGAVDYPDQGRLKLVIEHPAPSVDEGRTILLDSLNAPQRKVIRALVDQGIRSREAVAEDTSYSAASSTYSNLVSSVKTLGLIVYPSQGHVAMADWAQELLTGHAERIAA